MKYKDLRILAICFLGFVLQGCVKYDIPIGDGPLRLSVYSLSFDSEGGERIVKSSNSFMVDSITIDNERVVDDGVKNTPLVNQWCTVVNNGKSSTVQISPNETGKERKCKISYVDTGLMHFNVVTVVQSAD